MKVDVVVAQSSTRPRTVEHLALLVISVGLALSALEVLARILLPAPLPWRYPQTRYVPDRDLVFALQPSQHSYSADKAVTINERGFRGPLIPYQRTPGTLRLLFVGDSISFGYAVDDGDVFTERTAALLRRGGRQVDVVNTAVPAYNTEQEIASLARDGTRYDPDWVIVGVCWNDIGDKSLVRVSAAGDLIDPDDPEEPSPVARFFSSPLGYDVRNAMKSSRAFYGGLEGFRALIAGVLPLGRDAQFRADILEGRTSPSLEEGWDRFEAALTRLKSLSDEHGFRPLIVTFPIPLALEQPFPQSAYPNRVKELAARAGVAALDLEPAFRAVFRGHESLFVPYDGDHPNAAGHELAAREIARYVSEHAQDVQPQHRASRAAPL